MNEMTIIIKRAVKGFHEDGIIIFAKKLLSHAKKNIVQLPIYPYAISRIKNLNQNYGLEELIDFSFDAFWGLIKPSQIHDEILELLRILDRIRPKIVLEIGTAEGGTLFLYSHVSSDNAILMSVDLFYPKWKIPLYKSFALANQRIHLLRSDSHSQATLEKVKAVLNGENIDFLFIDGDHSYEGVKKDFEMYSHLVKRNGIIAFHDIVPSRPKRLAGGVPEFWQGIKDKWECKELVNDWSQNGCGIGLLFKNHGR